MILFDTYICIHISNARPAAVLQRFRDYPHGRHRDLQCGGRRVCLRRRQEWLRAEPAGLGPVSGAPGDLRADLERRGTSIGSLDTLIAAHALSLQLDNWVPSTKP